MTSHDRFMKKTEGIPCQAIFSAFFSFPFPIIKIQRALLFQDIIMHACMHPSTQTQSHSTLYILPVTCYNINHQAARLTINYTSTPRFEYYNIFVSTSCFCYLTRIYLFMIKLASLLGPLISFLTFYFGSEVKVVDFV